MTIEIGECGVCGSWWGGDLFPSGNKREDGTTPHDNLVCLLCQREASVRGEVDWWLDYMQSPDVVANQGQSFRGMQSADV